MTRQTTCLARVLRLALVSCLALSLTDVMVLAQRNRGNVRSSSRSNVNRNNNVNRNRNTNVNRNVNRNIDVDRDIDVDVDVHHRYGYAGAATTAAPAHSWPVLSLGQPSPPPLSEPGSRRCRRRVRSSSSMGSPISNAVASGISPRSQGVRRPTSS